MTDAKLLKWLQACSYLAGLFSTCAKKQYAAVILAPNGRLLGLGYNGSPPGMPHCKDGHCPRMQQGSNSGSQYDNCIAQHAEAGALLWSDPSMRTGATLVVNGPPCMGCAKLIASSGIKKVFCSSDPSYVQWNDVARFLHSCGIEVSVVE
jgi:dCMP deaminase